MINSKIHIVVNPVAGTGKAKRVAQSLVQKIRSNSVFDVDVTFTKEKNDAVFITRKAIAEGASMIIAVGGDGTINEVVNGFYIDGNPINPACELGVLNCGTGGGFAKNLFGTKSMEQQIEIIFQPASLTMDLGCITYRDSSGRTVRRLFVNECQTGIGSKVAEIVGKSSKIFGGTIAFGIAATVQAIVFNPQVVKLEYDNEPFQEFRLIGLVVGNGQECAGGMKLTPDAKLNDGLFDVLSIFDMNIYRRLLSFSKVYSGKHILAPYCSVKRCKKLKIISDSEITIEADGEVLGNSPFEIEVLPAAISVKAENNWL